MTVTETSEFRATPLDPDAQLMLRVRNDDALAFEELVRRYQGRLLTVLGNLVGSREQAEDLTQDVFLRIFRARKTYTPDAKFSTWIFTIANNVASNARRSRSRRREVHVAAGESSALAANPLEQMAQVASGSLPTRQLDKLERAEMVQLALESLSERQRLAVLLAKFEEMSYADIASVMDLSPPAVKSLISRARSNLKTILSPYICEGALPGEAAK